MGREELCMNELGHKSWYIRSVLHPPDWPGFQDKRLESLWMDYHPEISGLIFRFRWAFQEDQDLTPLFLTVDCQDMTETNVGKFIYWRTSEIRASTQSELEKAPLKDIFPGRKTFWPNNYELLSWFCTFLVIKNWGMKIEDQESGLRIDGWG